MKFTDQMKVFGFYHNNQPFNDNLLRPCPVLDNPGRLTEMVRKSGAESTDLQHQEDAGDLCAKCVSIAEALAPVADRLWAESRPSDAKKESN